MRRLIVWRHGNTDWNAGDRVQGQTDVPLNDIGRRQARESAELLRRMRPVAIVASDLKRAVETAAPLAAITGLPVRYDDRLRERYFGAWEGMRIADVARERPDEYARWTSGADVIGGGVETLDDLGKRVAEALSDAASLAFSLAPSPGPSPAPSPGPSPAPSPGPSPAPSPAPSPVGGGTVVVATHGAAARQGIGHLLGWPTEQLRTLRALQNCHWVELTHDPVRGWQMAAYNVGVFTDRPVPPPV